MTATRTRNSDKEADSLSLSHSLFPSLALFLSFRSRGERHTPKDSGAEAREGKREGREEAREKEGESERDGLAKETRADNVRVMVALGYFYIPGAPLKANVRDNASFPYVLTGCTYVRPSPRRATPRFPSRIRSRILHLLGECASARENFDGEGKRVPGTA